MAAGDRFSADLGTAEAAIITDIAKNMQAIGEIVQVEAQHSITEGAISGKGHVPSRPGQPPNQNTGTLANAIEVVQPEPLTVEINSNAPYSAALEFGTSKMAPRPFMGPAADRTRPDIEKSIADVVAAAVRKHFGA